jgi:hypothetical protein
VFCKQLLTSTVSVLQWIVAGAAVTVPVGAIFGVCYGGVLAILYGDAAIMVPVFIRFLCCAAAAGAIVGAFARLVDGHSLLVNEVVVEAGQLIPADGKVVNGVALIDEGALTGESPHVLRHVGDSASTIVAGTRVVSGRIRVRITRP